MNICTAEEATGGNCEIYGEGEETMTGDIVSHICNFFFNTFFSLPRGDVYQVLVKLFQPLSKIHIPHSTPAGPRRVTNKPL